MYFDIPAPVVESKGAFVIPVSTICLHQRTLFMREEDDGGKAQIR